MNRMHMEAPPFPLSSRAKPRDLQFYRLVLEMFFDRVRMQVEVKVCAPTVLGQCWGIDVPALPGWVDVWRSAVQASKPRPPPRNTSRTSL